MTTSASFYPRKLFFIAFFLWFLAYSCSANTDNRRAEVLSGERLHSLLDSEWQRSLKNAPTEASFLGDTRYNNKWKDLSLSAFDSRHKADKSALNFLANIELNTLNKTDKINYQLFKWKTQRNIDRYSYSSHLMPIDQLEGIQFINQIADYYSLNSYHDYQQWIQRLKALPLLISQTITLMELGIEQGLVSPKLIISKVSAQVKQHLVDNPNDSLFFAKFKSFPKNINKAQQQMLITQALSVIEHEVIPAYQKFYFFLINKYLPNGRDTVGIWDTPNGKNYYQFLINYYTTSHLTAEKIHNIGLKEVARNKAEMEKIIEEVKFSGSFYEFLTFLRTDPQFYYKTPEALLEGYQAITKRIDPQLPTLFGKLPRMPYGVIPIAKAMAPESTTAYYIAPSADGKRAGYYYVNLFQPHTRPKYEMEVLSVHEAVPGHHLQFALQMEQSALPEFRRYSQFTVFTEGWGLYSERLGYKMGLYKDPYSRFGQLTYDMWRAVRLVVDTGIHAKKWTRQQAIDYFMKNAAKSKEDINNEINRYIAWPGQALAYKIGQLKILELRDKAEKTLGNKFDIRQFHDVVLANGSIPLNVLEDNVNEWISMVGNSQ